MEKISATNNLSATVVHKAYNEFHDRSVFEIHNSQSAPALLIPLYSPLSIKYNAHLKRYFDVMISLVLIVFLLSWLIPILALIIKLTSRGPVFFLQQRTKSLGRTFTCIKLRTMIVNRDADILSACENDSRITKVGRILRRYHLDELPQLFNVLIGDMSIIGPRPHMLVENSKFEILLAEYSSRHSIRPGLTGLAQSYGNFGATKEIEKMKDRVDLDIRYIREWSFLLDIKILLRTCALIIGM